MSDEVPLLSPSDPDPGSWVNNTWHGALQWARMFGQTRVTFLLGKAHTAEPVEKALDPKFNFWKQPPTQGIAHRLMTVYGVTSQTTEAGWRFVASGRVCRGQLAFGEGVAQFIEDPAGPRWTTDDPFEQMLQKNDGIQLRIHDEEFARDVYRALCNVEWIHVDHGTYSCTWRYAGGLVADLRGLGEEYIDFYCSGEEGTISRDIADELAREGWTPKPV